MILYRWFNMRANEGICISYEEIETIKETSKGYWIEGYPKNRWVSKEGRKRYAYPTKEEAWINFQARKRKEIQILEARLRMSKAAFETMMPKKEYFHIPIPSIAIDFRLFEDKHRD